jgi:hypothetical protein
MLFDLVDQVTSDLLKEIRYLFEENMGLQSDLIDSRVEFSSFNESRSKQYKKIVKYMCTIYRTIIKALKRVYNKIVSVIYF